MWDFVFSPFSGAVELLLLIGWSAVIGGGTLFWIWMLVDCVSYETSEGNDRLIWTLVIILTSWVGALIYYFVRRPERLRQLRR